MCQKKTDKKMEEEELVSIRSIISVKPNRDIPFLPKNKLHCGFSIETPNKTYHFLTETPEELTSWVDVLNRSRALFADNPMLYVSRNEHLKKAKEEVKKDSDSESETEAPGKATAAASATEPEDVSDVDEFVEPAGPVELVDPQIVTVMNDVANRLHVDLVVRDNMSAARVEVCVICHAR